MGDVNERDKHINIAMRLSPDMANVQVTNLIRLLESGDRSSAHFFVDKMNLNDWVSRDSMHRLIDWISNSSGPLDESLAEALGFFPRAALIAGRDDLWNDFAWEVEGASQYWENVVGNLAMATSNANKGQYRNLLSDADTKHVIEMVRLPEYWREAGWPDQCQPMGDDDFVCK